MTQTAEQNHPDQNHPDVVQQVIAWRRHLHAHPELSFGEHQTAEYVEGELRKFPNLTLSRPTETSVLAVLRGTAGPGKTVLLRADMDALPITEETGLAFASTNAGVMHACGHDGHTAMLLGAARVLSASPETLHGEVRFIFQHAEELFPGGAQQVVDAGVMDGVDIAVGEHLMSQVPSGVVILREGALLAAPDAFKLTIRGKGGHGASPHTSVDPVVIAAQVILAFQTVISRLRDPIDPAVLSVTTLHAGTAHNIIPETVELGGTVRTLNPELRRVIPEQMENLVRGITGGYGATYTFEYENGYRATINDRAVTARLRDITRAALGDSVQIDEGQPHMGGEDFSAYLAKAPGTFIIVGAGGPERAPHHHPRFDFDESALATGTTLYVAAARELTKG